MQDELYDATIAVLAESGWDGLTLERVAEKAGRSRVTLWRNGITRESLLDSLLIRLTETFRDAMLPVLTHPGPPRVRMEKALFALCDVVDAHAEVLSVSDDMFHRAARAGRARVNFLDPFLRILAEARAAGQIRGRSKDIELADVLFNATAWPYLHFRLRHDWPPTKARRLVVTALLDGILV